MRRPFWSDVQLDRNTALGFTRCIEWDPYQNDQRKSLNQTSHVLTSVTKLPTELLSLLLGILDEFHYSLIAFAVAP